MQTIIHKRSDAAVRFARQVRDRINKAFVFCEGAKLIEEALSSGYRVRECFSTRETEATLMRLLHLHGAPAVRRRIVSEDVMRFVSDVKTPPGLIGIAESPALKSVESYKPRKKDFILVLHQLQQPQNVGALLRTAEAAGVTEVWLTAQTADPLLPKSIRASTGSVFRVRLRSGMSLHDALRGLVDGGAKVFGATQEGRIPYTDAPWSPPVALIVASEGSGFSIEELKYIKTTVRIPMNGLVDSLNVGTAAAVCLFEAKKHRTNRNARPDRDG